MSFLFILVCLPLVVHSDGGSSNGPGSSACLYYGDVDAKCNITSVKPDQIPDDCSSVIFFAAEVDVLTNKVSLVNSQIEILKSLLASKKKVFLYYSQMSDQGNAAGWLKALYCNTQDGGQSVRSEMEGLKAFLDQYPGIAGLILYFLDPGVIPKEFPCPTESFKFYIEVMRETFPDLIIGYDFVTEFLIDFYFNPEGWQWLDFTVLDPLIDFYVANIFSSRRCTPDLLRIGGFPLTGNFTYTVEKAMDYTAQSKIPKEKCLIQFTVTATPTNSNATSCSTSNTMMCTNPENFCEICTENLTSFFEKGKFAAKRANGFIVDCIDSDDPGGVCSCPSGPFPAFHAMLDGFNGADTPPICPKYDIWGA